jgi:hypothetical protein
MDVEIGEVIANVHAVDSSAMLSPDVMRLIVEAVLKAVEEREAHKQNVRAERRITDGVSAERDAEE